MSLGLYEHVCCDDWSQSGLIERIKIFAPPIISANCMIHFQALASKGMYEDLADAFYGCVKSQNPLLFKNMCLEMEAEHKRFLIHAEVMSLPRGLINHVVYEVNTELYLFV
ncbi:SCAN domain-containing protein 3 [Thelohanellus kitauei]|uniref:SCAN domain-containing protein 3 n=1 Tax=Thelohanellus kitauei TaxID=669202 RepID=A0A0C2NG35_THEKT|nr:SCAN domain-containing protein 3 [Thelohanellus kitauei]